MDTPIEALLKFFEKIKITQDHELDCDEVYAVIDIYAEAIAEGQDPKVFLPLVKHHLEICRDCLEEYEALIRILKASES